MTSSSSRADSGFAYSRDFFENLVDTALAATFRVTSSIPRAFEDSLPLHEAILRAVVARDPGAAADAMNGLLANSDRLLALVAAGAAAPGPSRTEEPSNR